MSGGVIESTGEAHSPGLSCSRPCRTALMKPSTSLGETLTARSPYSIPMKSDPSPHVGPLLMRWRWTAVMSLRGIRFRMGPTRTSRTPCSMTYRVASKIQPNTHSTATPNPSIGHEPLTQALGSVNAIAAGPSPGITTKLPKAVRYRINQPRRRNWPFLPNRGDRLLVRRIRDGLDVLFRSVRHGWDRKQAASSASSVGTLFQAPRWGNDGPETAPR